eukprot:maker-scaffold_13-snap-gene-9.52-mRNA-1 protein AED:0.49 eAED:0.49 QI:0/0/0/1/1/1/2/0/170
MIDKSKVLKNRDAVTNHEREGFKENNTVFGKILQGRLPASIVYEDENLLALKDISPASDVHYLIIPKEHITDYEALRLRHKKMLEDMVVLANALYKVETGESGEAAREERVLNLGFHRPPLTKVYHHLHLHVIWSMPAKNRWKRLLFPIGYGKHYKSPEYVIQNLPEEKS